MVLKVRGRKGRRRPKLRRFLTKLRETKEMEDCQETRLRIGTDGDYFLDKLKDIFRAINTEREVDNIYEFRD